MKDTIVFKGLLYGFSLISILTAATIQFYVSNVIDNKCDPDVEEYVNPTLIGGGSLVGSVLFYIALKMLDYYKKDTLRRISTLLQLVAVGVGLAAVGASLGQITILSKLKAGECLVDVDLNLSALQYSSVALVIASLAIEGAFSPQEKKNKEDSAVDEEEGGPVAMMKKPLVFL